MSIEKRLKAIESRNKKVELDKAWETSWTRRLSIVGLTYLVVLIFLHLIKNDNPPINALVPPTGFALSTLALKRVRAIWQNRLDS